jgi:hypothetical protein
MPVLSLHTNYSQLRLLYMNISHIMNLSGRTFQGIEVAFAPLPQIVDIWLNRFVGQHLSSTIQKA